MADTIKISLQKELGIKKDFEIKTSNRNIMKVTEMQLKMAQAEDTEGKTGIEIMKMSLEAIKANVDFLTDIFKLNKEQVGRLEDMDTTETTILVNRVFMRLMGNTDEEVEAIFAEPVEDGEEVGKE
ncbi:phage tail tube assembly chaperone [Jeotgalibaca porci]|uniref:phage tail tube assembly chaperone n=1 Tax=Jeotgalibaca porci TaxID=1868793 RepID=UPI0035A08EB8